MYEELVKRLRIAAILCLEAADAIEELEKFYQIMADAYETEVTKERWIPVTERLPEKEQCCLVVLNNRTVDFCFYTKRFGFGMYLAKKWESANDEVTHWMPLPEPPKEE